jgi:hypothetical protein
MLMAYTKVWDEAAPPGSLPADQIDTAIQDTKIALRERLEQVIPNFGSDAEDPKKVKAVLVGDVVDRPAVTTSGIVFVATDEGKVYFSLDGGTWDEWPSEAAVLRGTEAEKPNPATADFFYETDTEILYVNDGDDPATYVAVSGSSGAVQLVSLAGMKVYELSSTVRIENIAVSGSAATEPLILPGATTGSTQRTFTVANAPDFIPLAAKGRVKKATDIDFDELWSWGGVYRGQTGPTALASITIQGIVSSDTTFSVRYQVRNEDVVQDFDVEIHLFLLALDDEVVIP